MVVLHLLGYESHHYPVCDLHGAVPVFKYASMGLCKLCILVLAPGHSAELIDDGPCGTLSHKNT